MLINNLTLQRRQNPVGCWSKPVNQIMRSMLEEVKDYCIKHINEFPIRVGDSLKLQLRKTFNKEGKWVYFDPCDIQSEIPEKMAENYTVKVKGIAVEGPELRAYEDERVYAIELAVPYLLTTDRGPIRVFAKLNPDITLEEYYTDPTFCVESDYSVINNITVISPD